MAAITAISRLGHQPVAMEYFTAADVDALTRCLDRVAEADVYVGILARRYGFVPEGHDHSITELEYRAAEQAGVPTLMFLLAEDVEWPAELTDRGQERERLRVFREDLQGNKVVAFFRNPDDLAAQITAAVANAAPAGPGSESAPEFIAGPFSGAVGQFFKDREAELKLLQECLSNQNLRLLLVCGRGGVGKTALISRLLQAVEADSSHRVGAMEEPLDSVAFVKLGESEYRAPDKAVEFLCRTLPPMARRELAEKWKEEISLGEKLEFLFRHTLGSWRGLIVLDNFEDVLDDDNRIRPEYADLEQFVVKCAEYDHRAKILLTSRRSLVFSPEIEARIAPRRIELSLDRGLPEDAAEALLRDLDTDGSLGIRDAEAEILRSVAARCYGIPRTLETLVGRLRQKRTCTLSKFLGGRGDLDRLTQNPARELYESLAPDERSVVQAVAVYARPVPATAVQHVFSDLPVDDILDKLVCNYVVTFSNDLFSLHSLDRIYAYEQIPETSSSNGKAAFHERAAGFFRRLGKTEEQWKSIADLDPQLQVFHHLTIARQYEEACTLLNEIDREHLAVWGHYALIIELRSRLLGNIDDRALEGLNLGNLACAYLESGELEKAVGYYREALEIAREVGKREEEGRWLGNLGVALRGALQADESKELFERARVIAREIGDRKHQGRWLGKLAIWSWKPAACRRRSTHMKKPLRSHARLVISGSRSTGLPGWARPMRSRTELARRWPSSRIRSRSPIGSEIGVTSTFIS